MASKLEELRSKFSAKLQAEVQAKKAETEAKSIVPAEVLWTDVDCVRWQERFAPLTAVRVPPQSWVVIDAMLMFGKFKLKTLADLAKDGQGRGYMRFLYSQFSGESSEPVRALFRFVLKETDEAIRLKHSKPARAEQHPPSKCPNRPVDINGSDVEYMESQGFSHCSNCRPVHCTRCGHEMVNHTGVGCALGGCGCDRGR